jgi:hypothetical protein
MRPTHPKDGKDCRKPRGPKVWGKSKRQLLAPIITKEAVSTLREDHLALMREDWDEEWNHRWSTLQRRDLRRAAAEEREWRRTCELNLNSL